VASAGSFPARLETARLVLSRPEPDDLAALQAVIGDPRVPEWQFPRRFRGPADVERMLRRALESWDGHGFGPWHVRLADGTLVGRAGLAPATYEERDCVEALWFLSPDHVGRGYATEAARAAVASGFDLLRLDEVLAWTMTTNAPSQAVMRRLGFRELGPFVHVGLPHVAYALARADRDAARGG
jgi:RimJ/RimL family protein N-acetyltransferase